MRRAGRPGVVGVAARTAVVAGTATAVSGRVSRHQAEKAAAQQTVDQPDVQPAASAQAPPGAPSAGLTDEAISNLERLGTLHEQGVLTDEEFAVQKDRILRS
ncbi:SHOCT domain-containing protein [Streptomyces lunaelactis]|uniref:SHOCT domain-containing protein n=1 Tax=Streptomyces lunaelactis TaxID=1535768 RepID=UPI001585C95F|nr:SHOCT domain-containing protein [Streptomyces lunaelactis]NUK35599.1 SHOCT domain-containing protein [Streptomyces lunaelactis]NUK40621.1 SHOCT domain-containing protein [Streptomyces lunaelactis]NUK95153.1 SHOCT domain-containing protein [Streptomyces lunaelactis]NUL32112.1 SHOCT domain-containing protein [Streptomyces lunaelactis]